jgi:hypothetical protein
MVRITPERWEQTPDDLRRLAVDARQARTRERFFALFQMTQGWSALQWAVEIGRKHATVLAWAHAYNESGPEAVAFRHTGGWPPFAQRSKPT